MKFVIADLAEQCCPEKIELGKYDKPSTQRITAKVLGQIDKENKPKRQSGKKIISIIALVAALITLMSVAAYAISQYTTSVHEITSEDKKDGYWIYTDGEGNEVLQKDYGGLMKKGLYFNFTSEEVPYKAEFKANWLPEPPTMALNYVCSENSTDWKSYMIDDKENIEEMYANEGIFDAAIPYVITVYYAYSDRALLLEGGNEIVKQENWGELEMYEMTATKDIPVLQDSGEWEVWKSYENYVFLFSPNDGYLVAIGGTSDMETLEHIARELEVRVTDVHIECNDNFFIESLNIARG